MNLMEPYLLMNVGAMVYIFRDGWIKRRYEAGESFSIDMSIVDYGYNDYLDRLVYFWHWEGLDSGEFMVVSQDDPRVSIVEPII